MCLTIPGQLVAVDGTDPLTRTGVVDYGAERRTVQLLYLPEAVVGDWVVVHAGFATTRLAESEALEARRLHAELDAARRAETAGATAATFAATRQEPA